MTKNIPPMEFHWTGEAMAPLLPRLADRHFIIGEIYRLHAGRSRKSHNHYFAVVDRAWKNLPESISGEFPTSEHLRAHALIATGYCSRRVCAMESEAAAFRMAAFMRPSVPFSAIGVNGNTIVEMTPLTQSNEGMDAETFKRSKRDVIEYLAALIGVSVADLSKNAKKDAQ